MLLLSDYIILTLHAPSVVGAWREGVVLLYVLLMMLIAFFHAGTRFSLPGRYKGPLLLFLFFLVFYCACGEFSESSFRMFRSFAMPVLFALTVNAVCLGLTLETKLRVIFSTLVVMTFVSGAYALYQYQTISDAEQFWYWPLLSEKGFILEIYNSMRDGNPRMSGFFTGTLEFSAFILNTALFTLCLLVQAIRKKAYDLRCLIYVIVALFFDGADHLWVGQNLCYRNDFSGIFPCGVTAVSPKDVYQFAGIWLFSVCDGFYFFIPRVGVYGRSVRS
ncbi:hypothetical protein K2E95_08615 [Pseudomonas sp. ERGC3:01]|nr:hypothetical protein [Pseudomonas sp. ERGC3:01]